MDKQTELKKSYEFIIRSIDENTLFKLLSENFPELIKFTIRSIDENTYTSIWINPHNAIELPSSNEYVKFESDLSQQSRDDIDECLIAHLEQIEIKISDYLSLIDSDLHKWIAINRLQIDFKLYHENFGFQDFLNRSNIITTDPYDDTKIYIETQTPISIEYLIRQLIDRFYFHLSEVGRNLQSNLEFELIGATPQATPNTRKVKQKRKSDYTRSAIALVFSLLDKHKFLNFAHGERKQFANDIESIVDCDATYLSRNILSDQSDIKDISRASIDSAITLMISCVNDLNKLKTQYP